MLQTASPGKTAKVLRLTRTSRNCLLTFIARNTRRSSLRAGFKRRILIRACQAVAYFSMEFMLSEALPIYSGGLGNVAGDQLKAASNLGVPVIGVGLLYQQGYFRQEIDAQGQQQALYPFNDPGSIADSAAARAER